ncbi:hypothetical protein [Neorhodopirellula lusitana]|uniref:hypothetical protein n=1 Tax=Neorhodopirellula lusitana TaxID=445327 RepID=UPI0024B6381D|nr:hypothetical protein [Neorhodopirellula lusitana]
MKNRLLSLFGLLLVAVVFTGCGSGEPTVVVHPSEEVEDDPSFKAAAENPDEYAEMGKS